MKENSKEKLQKTYELCSEYICDTQEVSIQEVLESIAENLNDDNEMELFRANASILLINIEGCTASEEDYLEADELVEDVCGYLGELLAE